MGNETKLENWAARERLRWIERTVWWRGWIGRPDLVEMFGISAAQASSDLQKYQELNPGAVGYQTSRKRYEGAAEMRCVLHEPQLAEAISAYLGEGTLLVPTLRSDPKAGSRVSMVMAPRRTVAPEVERRVFLAVCGGLGLRVKYHSVRSGTAVWRRVVPRAFGHDGLRWHARAWCESSGEWRDFVLGRISGAEWPQSVDEEPPRDDEWEQIETLRLRVNPGLSEERKAALVMDYGAGPDGVLELRCRKAMRQYVEAMLRVPSEGEELPGHFVSG